MWLGKATCARDRTRHATAHGVRRAASPSSPSRLLPTSPALLPPLLVAVIAFGFVDCHGLRLNHRRDPLPSVTAADRQRHCRRCPPFPLSFSFRPPPASPSSSSSSSLSSTVVPFSPAKPLPSPHPIPPPPFPGSSPVRQWELGSTICSPSASVTNHPASATIASPTLPLYSLSLAEPHCGDSPASPSSPSPSFPPPSFHSGHQDRAPPSSPASSSPHRRCPLSSAPSSRRKPSTRRPSLSASPPPRYSSSSLSRRYGLLNRWHRRLPPRQGHDSISLPPPSPLHRRPPFPPFVHCTSSSTVRVQAALPFLLSASVAILPADHGKPSPSSVIWLSEGDGSWTVDRGPGRKKIGKK